MTERERDQSHLPVRRLYAADGIDPEGWPKIQSSLASDHFHRFEFASGVGVHRIETPKDWVRCAHAVTTFLPSIKPYACGSYAHYFVAVVWDDPEYGSWIYPACWDHLNFIVDFAQVAYDQIAKHRGEPTQ